MSFRTVYFITGKIFELQSANYRATVLIVSLLLSLNIAALYSSSQILVGLCCFKDGVDRIEIIQVMLTD